MRDLWEGSRLLLCFWAFGVRIYWFRPPFDPGGLRGRCGSGLDRGMIMSFIAYGWFGWNMVLWSYKLGKRQSCRLFVGSCLGWRFFFSFNSWCISRDDGGCWHFVVNVWTCLSVVTRLLVVTDRMQSFGECSSSTSLSSQQDLEDDRMIAVVLSEEYAKLDGAVGRRLSSLEPVPVRFFILLDPIIFTASYFISWG